LSGNPSSIAAGDGGVWVLDAVAGTVTQLDPSTTTAQAPIRVGPSPSSIAVGLGEAWITDEDGNLYRVDPDLGAREPIGFGSPLGPVAVDEETRSVWVGVLSPSEFQV
jgi:streptogramin lyase